jgi:FkbM family methyltransferase
MSTLRNLRGKLRRLWRGLNKRCVRATPLWLLGGTPREKMPIVNVGTGDGQWQIPGNLVNQDWIAYSVGVGYDASFETELSRDFGCQTTSFDPTPAAVEHVRSLQPVKFHFVPWGIWTHDGHLDFYSQDMNNKENLSVVDSERGEFICRVECFQLKTAMERLKHSRVDLLKIDIEGGWMPVIENLVSTGIKPRVFCVEFDSPTSVFRVRRAVHLLSKLGMHLVYRSKENYLFVDHAIWESHA